MFVEPMRLGMQSVARYHGEMRRVEVEMSPWFGFDLVRMYFCLLLFGLEYNEYEFIVHAHVQWEIRRRGSFRK